MRASALLLIAFACAAETASSTTEPAPVVSAATAEPEASTSASASKCGTEDHRAFDFWIGEWEVKTPDGKLAGHNRIESILGGCALREEWTGASGSQGTSLNIFDASRGVWHQSWVDNSGNLLALEGGLDGERLVLRGQVGKGDGATLHEIAWTPLENGRVRQHWRSSADGGTTWKDVFVGLYGRRPPRPATRRGAG